jgi:hypothetical protein
MQRFGCGTSAASREPMGSIWVRPWLQRDVMGGMTRSAATQHPMPTDVRKGQTGIQTARPRCHTISSPDVALEGRSGDFHHPAGRYLRSRCRLYLYTLGANSFPLRRSFGAASWVSCPPGEVVSFLNIRIDAEELSEIIGTVNFLTSVAGFFDIGWLIVKRWRQRRGR